MAIVCNKCKYVIDEAQITGYVLSDIYDVVKAAAPAIASACILAYIQKRGYVEAIALMFMNKQNINCPSCMKYEGWIDVEDKVNSIEDKKI